MNGLCYGNVSGITGAEITISVIVMVIGASFYAKVFADFETIIRLSRKDKLERRLVNLFFFFTDPSTLEGEAFLNNSIIKGFNSSTSSNKFEQAKEFCVKRKIPLPMRKKIKQYFNSYIEGVTDGNLFNF